jgi:hypothetical protein
MVAAAIAILGSLVATSCTSHDLDDALLRIFDHADADVDGLSDARLASARDELRIAYWHTSHGSQLVDGMGGMDAFYGGTGRFALGGTGGLRLDEQGTDIGNPGIAEFDAAVRAYLADAANASTNVVIASWCGQVSGASEETIADYLARMAALEADFPDVAFIYMTGHADGSGLEGNLHLRNAQIREYCEVNEKWLFDFYDIECYDPDGTYFGDKRVSDACNYDFDGDGATEGSESGPADGDRNWAIDWQDAHPGAWWNCGSAHSQPLNANRKAKAAWQLWCALAERI